MLTKIKTADRDQWLELRKTGIGGSDAGAVLGLNPYKSPYALWAEKTGAVEPDDVSTKESVRLGNDLEEYVAKRFTEETGKKVRKENYTLYNDAFPFALANLDRVVVGEKAGLECKTTSSYEVLQKCRNGEYPDTWYCQMTHYMMVTGYEKYYLAVIVWGSGFYVFELERREEEIEALAKAEAEFWQHVTDKTPPPVDGSESTLDTITTLYPDSNDGRGKIDLTAVSSALQLYEALDKQQKALALERDAYKAQIMEFLADAPGGVYGDYNVTYKTQERKTFDKARFEREVMPIPEQYYTKSVSRPFRLSIKKSK